jgi:DNA polymerase III delta prime subunit
MEIENNSKLFIHKYQPIYFGDFEIDENIVEILNTLIEIDNLNILIIGDMGSGKTSLMNAIILEYYKGNEKSAIEENILHINSLKEQGINYYRNDVKTFCQTTCSIYKKKKIIVLDDIDFINEQSQQVFRNCIDKFSHNVHFICTTTSHQKVIESLQSRLLTIKIKSLQKEKLHKIMKKIMSSENINMSLDVQLFILDICNNTAKILINYMEKCKLLNTEITMDVAKSICANISFSIFQEYTENVKKKNLINAIELFYSIYDKGFSVIDILDNYFLFIKSTSMLTEEEKYKIIPLLCKYITIFHNIHEDEIELSIFTNNLIQSI